MKRSILTLIAIAALAMPVTAQADNGRPSVHLDTAERQSAGFLTESYSSWRYRDFGFIDCYGGKINRFTWSCAVAWGQGHQCHRGRVRVTGLYREETTNIFNVHFRGVPPYECIGR